MRKIIHYFLRIQFGLLLILLVTGCEDEYNPRSRKDNFEVLWTTINERYCFFSYKDIDWYEVKKKYEPLVDTCRTSEQLFYVFADMLAELKDGHVNLYSSFDVARYWKWFEDYPRNFYANIQERYLGTDYKIAGGLKYKMLPDSVGYIYYGSFSSPVSNSNITAAFEQFKDCRGIILDIRDNGGGNLSIADLFAGRFADQHRTIGYIKHKKGPGYNDFSTPKAITLSPSQASRWDKKVVLLTNRHCFSAANYFVMIMRQFPNVTVMGDKTGGGSGLPLSSELPIGWSLRFSASPILNEAYEDTEFGIDPDVFVSFTDDDYQNMTDPFIEKASLFINSK